MTTVIPALSDEDADRLARAEIEACRARVSRSRSFLVLESSDRIVRRGQQVFAVFGSFARELAEWSTTDASGNPLAARPAIVEGRAWLETPEEGRPGLLHFLYSPRRETWTAAFLYTGWLWTRELEMSNAEIADRIADEIDRGENVLLPKPPGWA